MAQFEGGPPLFHASVAFHSPYNTGSLPLRLWPQSLHADAERIALRALRGIGNEYRQKWEGGMKALHLRRVMSAEEQQRLGGDIAAIRMRFGKEA
jgi:hypothetical protein